MRTRKGTVRNRHHGETNPTPTHHAAVNWMHMFSRIPVPPDEQAGREVRLLNVTVSGCLPQTSRLGNCRA